MDNDTWERLARYFERDIVMAQQGRRHTAQTDYYAGANYGFNANFVHVDDLFYEPQVTSADHAFELFVKGELNEERYGHWVSFYKGKRLSPEQERLERIRSMPKMKQRFTRLKPWE